MVRDRPMIRRAEFGFGVIAGLAPDVLTTVAREVAQLGYRALWINDGGRAEADGLAGLAVVAAAAPDLRLCVGVLPLDRRSPAQIAAHVTDLGLPLDRLALGVGSGGAGRPLGLVREGVAELRLLLPGVAIFMSALGPRMSGLAGEIADGVLFNWAVPDRLLELSAIVAGAERDAGRGRIERWAYVRAAVGPDATARLAAEAERYAGYPGYGRAFETMGRPFDRFGVAGPDLPAQLAAYRSALDGVVVRALPVEWDVPELIEIARAAVEPEVSAPSPR
jgi:alkanesulfonate monooxygenase SsuD/methylene tetrahydromethanopterin reductase-like flavin-dependent oxidoreductase (luciferase family)